MRTISKLIFKIAIILSGIIGSCYFSQGQIALKGYISDSLTKESLANATVFVTTRENEKEILKYSITDGNGRFMIVMNSGLNLVINVTHINYIPVKKDISVVDNTSFAEINVSMLKSSDTLAEVFISSHKPMYVDGDTINFNTKYFEKGTDKVVEDLLKRLPGVEVDEKGKIFVQGKELKKVNVENDDLSGKDYQIITKNLSNKAVEKIQIVKHYLDDPIFKGVKQSDDIALNLVLTKDAKSKPFGNVDGGGSVEGKYEARMNIISFLPGNKFYVFASGNNNGGDIGLDFTGPTETEDASDVNKLIFSNAEITTPYVSGLKNSRYLKGNSQLGSAIWINKPNEKTKIQNILSLSKESRPFQYYTENSYFGASSIKTTEDFNNLTRNTKIENNLKYEYNYNKDRKIINNFSVVLESAKKDNMITLNMNENIFFSRLKVYTITNRVSYLKKRNENLLSIISGKILVKSIQDEITVLPGTLQNYFQSEDVKAVNQDYLSKSALASASWELLYNFRGININTNTSFSIATNQLVTGMSATLDSLSSHKIIRKAENNLLIPNKFAKSDIKITKKKDRVNLSLGIGINFMSVGGGKKRNDYFFINSTNSIKWQVNNSNNFVALYSFSPDIEDINKLFTEPVLSGYNKISYGIESPILFNNSIFLLNYQFGNWSDAFLLSFTGLYQSKNKSLTNNLIINPDFILSHVIPGSNQRFVNLTANVDKYLSSISRNIKFKYTYNNNNFSYFLQNSPQLFFTQSHGPQLSYRSSFDLPVNINIGSEFKMTNNLLKMQNKVLRDTYSNYFADVYLDLKKGFSGSINFEATSFPNPSSRGKFHSFLDISFNKSLKSQKLSTYLRVSNLFDNKFLSFREITLIEESISSYELSRRYILLGLSLRF